MPSRSSFALALLSLLPACGGGTGGSSNQPRELSLSFGAFKVPAGTEHTQCIVKRLGNSEPLHVGAVHNVLGEASHHMVVYRTNDPVEKTTPYDCRPFADTLDPSKGSPIMITQKKDDLLQLPEGVAYVLDPNQMIRVELHYINATNADIMLDATTTMIETLDMQQEANFMLIGDTDIVLQPQQEVTLGPIFYPLDPIFADAKFFAITGHEHQLGTNVEVAAVSSAGDSGTMVYDVPNWSWSEPATVVHDPAFSIASGGGFRFTCDWFNPAPAGTPPVTFGESAEDEMCFFWAYYYPSHGTKVCLHSDRGGQTINHCLQ
jgi:hypothetical protein